MTLSRHKQEATQEKVHKEIILFSFTEIRFFLGYFIFFSVLTCLSNCILVGSNTIRFLNLNPFFFHFIFFRNKVQNESKERKTEQTEKYQIHFKF